MGYGISPIPRGSAALSRLLNAEGIRVDAHLEYTVGAYDEAGALVATGSIAGDTLRCLAVDSAHRGEGLMNLIVSHLAQEQARRGRTHLFLYTKPDKEQTFRNMGFFLIVRTEPAIFMENRRDGFERYVGSLKGGEEAPRRVAAIVMNANPFTLGHLYLVERASRENDLTHLFVVSEDLSAVPFSDRYAMVVAGVAHLPNVRVHETAGYMISSATFPAYFLKDDERAAVVQAHLDIAVFSRIAGALGISRRYVGEEPLSPITELYNQVMARDLPGQGIECVVVSRKALSGEPISASRVRALLCADRLEAVRPLVPETTYAYLASDAGRIALSRIQSEKNETSKQGGTT